MSKVENKARVELTMKNAAPHNMSFARRFGLLISLSILSMYAQISSAQEATSSALSSEIPHAESTLESTNLQKEQPVALTVEELKRKVIKLNRDLFILEEDLLFPANTQFTVYLSVDSGEFFRLDSVILSLDDEVVASHLYTDRQFDALKKGGMQRLHIGNLKKGPHELKAVLVGKGTDGREVRRAAQLSFEKKSSVAAFEIKIKDQSENYQADVAILQWD